MDIGLAEDERRVKVEVDGIVRKVCVERHSFEALERSLSSLLALPIGSFSISYIDTDGDLITLPRGRVTVDEMEEFNKIKSPRLFVKSVSSSVSAVSMTSSIKRQGLDNAGSSCCSNASSCCHGKASEPVKRCGNSANSADDDKELEKMYEPADCFSTNQNDQTDEDKEEEEDNDDNDEELEENINENDNTSTIPNWAKVFSDRTTVRCIQDAIASPIVTDFVSAIGVSLVAGEKAATFQVMFSYGPKIYTLFNDVFVKHPELKDVVGEMISFLALGPRNKKSCPFHRHKKFKHKESENGGRRHCSRKYRKNHMDEFRDTWNQYFFNENASNEPPHKSPIHCGVVCDGCSTNCELRAKSIQHGCSSVEKCGSRYIAGVRYKSATVRNFDLCESCESSQVFQKTHGPFLKLVTPCQAQPDNRFSFQGNSSAQASSGCTRRRQKYGFGSANDSECLKKRQEQKHISQPSQFPSPFASMGACQEKKKDDPCILQSLFAKAASFYSTSQAVETDSSKKCEDNTSKDCKSQDMGCSKDPLDEKLIQQGIELIDTFMKAASVAPAPSKESSNDKCIVSDDNEIPEKWKSAIETLQGLGFVEWKSYLSILEEEEGNLDHAITRIVSLSENS